MIYYILSLIIWALVGACSVRADKLAKQMIGLVLMICAIYTTAELLKIL